MEIIKQIINIFDANTIAIIRDLSVVFGLNAASTALNNLKTLFLSRQITKPVYITTFLDACIFAYSLKIIADSTSLYYILFFALGRILGVFMAEKIEAKLALGIIEINAYKHKQEGIEIADKLREIGYSVTTEVGYGIEGRERLILSIITERKNLSEIKEVLESSGNVNMTIKNINTIIGKVGRKHVPKEVKQ